MTWFFKDVARFKLERERLEALEKREAWCTIVDMKVDGRFQLSFDIDIAIGTVVYPVVLRYPAHFSATPPSVHPRGELDVRWSWHQYGPGGELCLEYGPDIWTPDITGAAVIESAHRLLETEQSSSGQRGEVMSRHATTLGQKVRGETFRMVVTPALQPVFDALPAHMQLHGTMVGGFRFPNGVYAINTLTLLDGTVWTNPSYPQHFIFELGKNDAVVVRLGEDDALPKLTATDFRGRCTELGIPTNINFIVFLRGAEVRAYLIFDDGNDATEIAVIPAQPEHRRLSVDHDRLAAKTVGIVGCGSVGSKMATSLARSGVGKFVLLDDDILLPQNLVRHDLDARDVGLHKVAALARRLERVNPAVDVRTRQTQLAGQESADSAETALNLLSQCDLIIDATANAAAFNLISAVASGTAIAVLWAEVFPGGMGGVIARSRPGREPPPQLSRRVIDNWLAENGFEPVVALGPYALETEQGPVIADDADVSVIAASATRLAIDTLTAREPSIFPYSAYAIGLIRSDIFTQPFDTRPIELGEAPADHGPPALPVEEAQGELLKLFAAFEKQT